MKAKAIITTINITLITVTRTDTSGREAALEQNFARGLFFRATYGVSTRNEARSPLVGQQERLRAVRSLNLANMPNEFL
jgi:hypothetical protein